MSMDGLAATFMDVDMVVDVDVDEDVSLEATVHAHGLTRIRGAPVRTLTRGWRGSSASGSSVHT